MYDGSSLVSNAVAGGKPFIFVAVNYRVGGFGFMPGKEILAGKGLWPIIYSHQPSLVD